MDKQSRKEMMTAYKERKVIGGICAIKNNVNGKQLLAAVSDLQGYKNRYEFSQKVGGCLDKRLEKDWEQYGADAFVFEVLEELVKTEKQSDEEFKDDIKVLKQMWLEKLNTEILY